MDHSMPMPRCSMNMLWNWQIVDTCIVFRTWHVSSTLTFLISCAAIMGLGVLYEALRTYQKTLDARIARELAATVYSFSWDVATASDDTAHTRKAPQGLPVPRLLRLLRAALYGASVFLSFFLMLVFMTYNAYLILATVFGAALGHFIFSGTIHVNLAGGVEESASRGMACH